MLKEFGMALNRKGIPVLMYHDLVQRSSKERYGYYEIWEQEFEAQVRLLTKLNFEFILLEDLKSNRTFSSKSVIITFDDGHVSNYTIAFPILTKIGLRAEFFVTANQIGQKNRVHAEHLREMARYGMRIGSHGLTHTYLDNLSYEEAKRELQRSKEILSNIIGKTVCSFSAPGGRFRKRDIKLAKDCGYLFFCTSRPGFLKKNTSPLNIPRMLIPKGDINQFHKIVSLDPCLYLRRRAIYSVLRTAKRILGNKNYEKIHSIIIRKIQGESIAMIPF